VKTLQQHRSHFLAHVFLLLLSEGEDGGDGEPRMAMSKQSGCLSTEAETTDDSKLPHDGFEMLLMQVLIVFEEISFFDVVDVCL
jgi:hypothetical protein